MAPIRELISTIVHGITIEPMVTLYYLSSAIFAFACGNVILQKACHPDLTVEPDYSLPCPDEGHAQQIVTSINSWKVALESIIPLLFVIFLGTWSDTHGKRRKPLLFIPVIGEIVRTVTIMVCVYYWQISPVLTAVMEAGIKGLSGGYACFSFGANTYISDISSVENRTVRIGIIGALAFIGSPIGIMLGGILRMKLGFFNLFAICLGMNIITLILGVLFMKNPECTESKLKTFEGVCDPSQFIQSIKTVFKKRPGNTRLILLLMGCVAPLYIACFVGEWSVMYFFLRYKFQMNEVEFGNYCAFKMITIFVGSFVSLIICSKVFKMSDAMIGALGTFTQIASAIGLCFSEYKWQLYFFPVVDLMHGAAGTASRSIISKNIDSSELGQVFSVISAVDVFAPLVIIPVYNMLYKYSLHILPGSFYLLSVFLALLYLILFAMVYAIQKRSPEDKKIDKTDKSEPQNTIPLL